MEQFLTANISGKVRRVNEGGKSFLVAPSTLIVPGVLAGSKGPLLYKPEDIRKSAAAWNGMPLVIYHPHDPITNQPLSAQDPEQGPGVLEKQGVGEVRKSQFGKKHTAEAWFDEDRLKKVSPVTHKRLLAGEQVELSTGLFTDNVEEAGSFHGKPYVAVATNFRPDHLAILPDQLGACSIKDGCGVLVNQRLPSLREKLVALNLTPTASEVVMNKLQQLVGNSLSTKLQSIANSNPEGINQYSKGGSAHDEKGKFTNGNGGAKGGKGSGKVHGAAKSGAKETGLPARQYRVLPNGQTRKLGGVNSGYDQIGPNDGPSTSFKSPPGSPVREPSRHPTSFSKSLGFNRGTNNMSSTLQDKLTTLLNSNPEGCNQYKDCGGESKAVGKISSKPEFEAGSEGWEADRQGWQADKDSKKAEESGTSSDHDKARVEYQRAHRMHGDAADKAQLDGNKEAKQYHIKEYRRTYEKVIHHSAAMDKATHNAAEDRDRKLGFNIKGTHNMSSNLQDKLTALLNNSNPEGHNQYTGGYEQAGPGEAHKLSAELRTEAQKDGIKMGTASRKAFALSDAANTKEEHLNAAKAHEAVASRTDNENLYDLHKQVATAHAKQSAKMKPGDTMATENADVVENDNQVQQEGGPTMATVTLNAEERGAVVNGLIGGECCFEEDEREVLNSLSDRTLARLTLNANGDKKEMPKFIQDKIDAKAAKEEEEAEEPEVEEEEEVENVDDQATEEKDRAGLGPRAGKGTGKNESQAQGNVKPMGDLNPKATNNQLSAEDRQFLAIGRKVIADRRGMLINTITANSRNPFDTKELAVMNLDQLEKLGQLAAVENEVKQPAFTLNRFASYMGSAAGAGIVNNDDGTDDDCLPLPTINWKEKAKV